MCGIFATSERVPDPNAVPSKINFVSSKLFSRFRLLRLAFGFGGLSQDPSICKKLQSLQGRELSNVLASNFIYCVIKGLDFLQGARHTY